MARISRSGWRVCSLVLVLPMLWGTAQASEVEQATAEATDALVEILHLWHVEDYGAIYDQGTATTKRLLTREEFIGRMKGLGCRTTCCYTTFELRSAEYRSPELVVVTGTVGLEFTGRVAPRFRCAPEVRSYPMTREEGGWRIDLTLLLPFF